MTTITLTEVELPAPESFRDVFMDAERATIYELAYYGRFAFLICAKSLSLPLGNHYHRGEVEIKKLEQVHVVAGNWRVVTQPVDENGRPVGPRVEQQARAGQTVSIPALTWHAFYAETAGAMLMEFQVREEDYRCDIYRLP